MREEAEEKEEEEAAAIKSFCQFFDYVRVLSLCHYNPS